MIDVVVSAPVPPRLYECLEGRYRLHDYVKAADKPTMVAEIAPVVRALVTSARIGATKAFIDSFPNLEMISCVGTGYGSIDVAAAKARGIPVGYTPGVLDDEVADYGIALMLAVARRIVEGDRFARAGRWKQGLLAFGTKVGGKRLGIVGLGAIGRLVAKRALAFDMQIAYFGPRRKDDVPYEYFDDVAKLAASVDYLMLTCPGGKATANLIDARVLAALGPAGFLINIARGSVVDEPALIAALTEKLIAGAALDVYVDEPNIPEALFALDNVVLSPHQASASNETRRAMADLAVANLEAFFAGKPLVKPVPE